MKQKANENLVGGSISKTENINNDIILNDNNNDNNNDVKDTMLNDNYSDKINKKDNNFSPLIETPIERGYEKRENIIYTEEIPEPEIEPEIPFILDEDDDEEENNIKKENNNNKNVEEKTGIDNIKNPDLNALDEKDKMLHARQMADQLIDYYETAHILAQDIFTFSDNSLNKKAVKNEIDLNEIIPSEEAPITLKEFANGINNEIKSILTVSDEFKEAIKPPLTRICAKRGWGMTDEQFVLSMVGKDLLMKGYQVIGLRKGLNSLISAISEANKLKKEELKKQEYKRIIEEQENGNNTISEPPKFITKPVKKKSNLSKDEISGENYKSVVIPKNKSKKKRKPSAITISKSKNNNLEAISEENSNIEQDNNNFAKESDIKINIETTKSKRGRKPKSNKNEKNDLM